MRKYFRCLFFTALALAGAARSVVGAGVGKNSAPRSHR
jgi:hypothetical protein